MSQHRMMMTKGFNQEPTGTYTANLIISSNTANYDIRAACIADGWNGTDDLVANVIINSGVIVYSTSVSTFAIDTNSSGSFPASYTLELTNNGQVIGKGGDGGDGADAWAYSNGTDGGTTATAGTAGGDAIRARCSISITNNGTIWAGGGGGGGGGRATHSSGGYGGACAGSGGGGGMCSGGAGAIGTRTETVSMISSWVHNINAAAGIAGTLNAPGGGQNSDHIRNYENTGKGSTWVTKARGGQGGAGSYGGTGGGSYASADGDSGNVWLLSSSGAGGAGGDFIVGNSNVTWITQGTTIGGSTN